jgi:hypothetical protein
MVEICLNVDGTKTPFLCVPNRDIRRLAIRPFKWLWHVMFCICGAHGELHAMSDDSLVDYNSTSLSDVCYEPRGKVSFRMYDCFFPLISTLDNFIFVDHHGLNDQITTTTLTRRRRHFRDEVEERDGPFCVITGTEAIFCDAAHLTPNCKGHKVTFHDHSSMRFFNDVCSSTFWRFSRIVLFVTTLRLSRQFLGLTMSRMDCYWTRPCMQCSPGDILPS